LFYFGKFFVKIPKVMTETATGTRRLTDALDTQVLHVEAIRGGFESVGEDAPMDNASNTNLR
jgi:hypothetical protein